MWDIGLDAAATRENRVSIRYCGPDHPNPVWRDGLTAEWRRALIPRQVVWCNPPYGRGQIVRWCRKAVEEAAKGVTTIMLLPADTSTGYFHEFVLPRRHAFLKTRLKFKGAPLDSKGRLASAKFGSVLVVFEPERSWRWA